MFEMRERLKVYVVLFMILSAIAGATTVFADTCA